MKFVALGFALALVSSAQGAEVGKQAPAFSIQDSQGKKVELLSQRGKFVVLEWLNYDCPFVRKHYGAGNMQALQKKYTAKGVTWYAIVSSAAGKEGAYSADELNAMAKERKAHQTAILLDSEGVVGRAYGAKTTPHMYVIDPSGKLVYEGAIDDKPTAKPSDIPGARNLVAQALDEAMAGKPVSRSYERPYGCSVKY